MHEYWRNIKLHHMITKLLPIGEVVALGLIPCSKDYCPFPQPVHCTVGLVQLVGLNRPWVQFLARPTLKVLKYNQGESAVFAVL